MDILILTRGRPNRQTTFDNLPATLQKQVIIVNQFGEKVNRTCKQIESPETIRGIADKCQWVIENFGPTVVMLDDDLIFAKRRSDETDKFRNPTEFEMMALFNDIHEHLDTYAHVGVSAREGANRNDKDYIDAVRMMRVMAYRTDVLRQEGIRFDRLPVMQDFDVTLQLLRKGYPNRVINWMVQNQNGSNTEGGCALFRNDDVQKFAAEGLASYHPDFVTVEKKQTKKAWGGKERYDVRVQWKAALKSAGTVHLLGE